MNIRHQLMTLSHLAFLDQQKKQIEVERQKLVQKRDHIFASLQKVQKEYEEIFKKQEFILNEKRNHIGQLEVEKTNLRKWEGRAEKIKGEREYTALLSEINTQKKLVLEVEAKLNNTYEQAKLEEVKIKKLVAEIEDLKKAHGVEEAQVEEEGAKVSAKLASLENERKSLLSALPSLMLRKYEMVGQKRGGMAIALIKNQVCQGCSRALPPELYLKIMRAELVDQCPSCQRLLVGEEHMQTTR